MTSFYIRNDTNVWVKVQLDRGVGVRRVSIEPGDTVHFISNVGNVGLNIWSYGINESSLNQDYTQRATILVLRTNSTVANPITIMENLVLSRVIDVAAEAIVEELSSTNRNTGRLRLR